MRLTKLKVFVLFEVLAPVLYAFLEVILHLVYIFQTILGCEVVESIEG